MPGKGMPDCPKWLIPEAKKEWERLCVKLSMVRFIRRFIICSGISNIIPSMTRGLRFWKAQRMDCGHISTTCLIRHHDINRIIWLIESPAGKTKCRACQPARPAEGLHGKINLKRFREERIRDRSVPCRK